ncbi:hypothetical protein [Luteolibacter sp. Populi]|uniref:hypothetical protein n=1 Tax=Luteolibacter sp. Populi TaxID=3230487 RepID=UPI0034662262
MKTTVIIAIALFPFVASARDLREIRLEECPQAVQSTVRDNARDGRIDEVDLIEIEGNTIYIAEAEFAQDRDMKIYVSGSGALIKTVEDVPLAEVPAVVAEAARKLGSIDEVDKETRGGTVTYHVEVDRPGQRDLDLEIAANGAILKQTEEAKD